MGVSNYSLWAKLPNLVFLNKVLLEHSHILLLFIIYGYFSATMAETETVRPAKSKILNIYPFTEKDENQNGKNLIDWI